LRRVAVRLNDGARGLFARVTACAISAALFVACFGPEPARISLNSTASEHPLTHLVQPGETIYHIAHLYGVTPARLMADNGITDPRQLWVGERLIVPGRSTAANSLFTSPDNWPPRADRQFAWPVAGGYVSSPFGIRNGVMHHGVDIVAPVGSPVRAADNGTAIFVGHLRGYGNVVILQHSGDYVTVYGHNQRNLVSCGAKVIRGEEIATLGSTGRATGPNLHFEVRFHGQPQNPLAYLSPFSPTNGIHFAASGGS
jgi:murein DD-endopeptidase MepM/ murein hydrolase activator NlpD